MTDLRTLAREFRLIADAERERPMVACPVDGEPLNQGPRNTLYCPFCGHRYPANSKQGDVQG